MADVKACEHVMEGVWNKRRGTSANLRIQLLLATAQLTPARSALDRERFKPCPQKIRKDA